ncbi:Aldehyde dehydrogenase family 3 member F1 [Bienertia sinuspersici]
MVDHHHQKTIVKRLLGGKFGTCGGQVCVGLDYILVEKKQSSHLVTCQVIVEFITMQKLTYGVCRFIEPTILINPPLDAEIMTEEIFGPLLPIITYAAETVPFGGVGESGIGRYHGKYSFDTFSHEKPVLKRALFPDFWFRYPPWDSKKLQLLREAFSFNYFFVILVTLGLKRPRKYPEDI